MIRQNGGVIAVRDHPQFASTLSRLVRERQLVASLPGVYVPLELSRDPLTRIRAAMMWDPDAVVFGGGAALVSFWPGLQVGDIALAVPGNRRITRPGYRIVRRVVPPELVRTRGPVRFTAPALTALDLCDTPVGAGGIDTVLRTRAATLAQLHQALEDTRHRRGNQDRRALLLDSRDEPWSAAERLAHRLLREAGISGWRANVAIATVGQIYFGDIVFRRQRLVLEVDGRRFHDDLATDTFEYDRWRQNHLVLAGWRVLRVTWTMLTDHPVQVVSLVRQALEGP
ncbi:hypothetical protein GCM10009841_14780 [Microlunatus panaciterrae]|uniref:Very-short-patch-repair endonuclease n=1 Tax=Microlunatus panaciterrae TaxID=400768 RepID=A0ABS2RLZ8_9ACTN|nr:very-short-patch-repair endonuclease [Microlunatus panaciterrae]